MRGRAIVAALAVLATVLSIGPAPAVASTSDWPQFRFNRRHTGRNPNETTIGAANVTFLGPAWQAQLGTLVDSSSPAVVGGVVYIGSTDGTLWAYPSDGCGRALCTTPIWRSVSLAQIIDSPTVAHGVVYVGSQTSPTSNDGRLNAFDASGCPSTVCSPLWQGDAGPESILESSPALGNGSVFVGAFDGRLFAFPANGCGRPLCPPTWTGSTGGSIESTPTVVGGVVYVGSDDGSLYAFDARGCGSAACSPLWTGRIGSPVYGSTPAVAHGRVAIGSAKTLAVFDADGCAASPCDPLWSASAGIDFFGGSPAIAGGRIYLGLENGLGVYAAAGCGSAVCSPLWTDFGSGAQASVQSSPTVANGVVYVGRNTGQVLAWSAAPCGASICSELWSGFTQDPIVSSSPTVVNGRVYIGSADDRVPEDIQGRIYVFELV